MQKANVEYAVLRLKTAQNGSAEALRARQGTKTGITGMEGKALAGIGGRAVRKPAAFDANLFNNSQADIRWSFRKVEDTGYEPLLYPDYLPVNEDMLVHRHPLPQEDWSCADMTFFETPKNGAVFSTGSITFCGSLPSNNFDNNCSKLLSNVLDRVLRTETAWGHSPVPYIQPEPAGSGTLLPRTAKSARSDRTGEN